jgi:hypothetical protein
MKLSHNNFHKEFVKLSGRLKLIENFYRYKCGQCGAGSNDSIGRFETNRKVTMCPSNYEL